jgi:hypothetical protein
MRQTSVLFKFWFIFINIFILLIGYYEIFISHDYAFLFYKYFLFTWLNFLREHPAIQNEGSLRPCQGRQYEVWNWMSRATAGPDLWQFTFTNNSWHKTYLCTNLNIVATALRCWKRVRRLRLHVVQKSWQIMYMFTIKHINYMYNNTACDKHFLTFLWDIVSLTFQNIPG